MLSTEQKQAYLSEMGIEPWYPRVALPNSMPAIQLIPAVVPEIEPVSEPPANSASVVQTPQPDPIQLKSSVPVEEGVQPPAPVAQPSVVVDQLYDKPVRFGLAIYVIGDWLITSSLVPNYQQLNDADVRLIQAIVKAIDGTNAAFGYHHVISWPFFSNPQASQGAEAAKRYVNGVIEHLAEEHEVKKLLSFGGVLAKLNDWQSAEGSEFNLARLNLPSVYKMLHEPALKAKAWDSIRQSALFAQ